MAKPRRASASRKSHGFTLVELVVVMMLIGVLASVGMSRFVGRQPFEAQAGADQLQAALRTAQATAQAQRVTVYVQLAATPLAVQLCLDSACTQTLAPMVGGTWLPDANALTLGSAAQWTYAPDGSASLTAPLLLQVSSADGSAQAPVIRVEAGSGHVHQP